MIRFIETADEKRRIAREILESLSDLCDVFEKCSKYDRCTPQLPRDILEDDILDVSWKESELENDDLKNYKAKAEYYILE